MVFSIKTLKNNASNKLSFTNLLIEKDRSKNVMAYYVREAFGISDAKLLFMR